MLPAFIAAAGFSGASAEAALPAVPHTVLFPLKGNAGGYVGRVLGENLGLSLREAMPAEALDGSSWSLSDLIRLPGFQLLGASLRWSVTDRKGERRPYALFCGASSSAPLPVLEGENLWEVSAPIQAWLASGLSAPLQLLPAHTVNDAFMRVQEGSLLLQLRFSMEADGPDFPLDRIRESPLMENSLRLLEAGNLFLEKYNEETDSLVLAEYPLGVPYFYAGDDAEKLLSRHFPDVPTRYYREGRMYLYGLDCAGMTRLVWERCGWGEHPSILSLLHRGGGEETLTKNKPAAWPSLLQPGDLIAVKHRTNHIMIYLGTLRQFGWTEENAGEAAEILDAPLVIHCGGNPFYYERYQAYIQEREYPNTWPPDGGVTVSVLQENLEGAPHTLHAEWGRDFGWYMLEGQPLLIFPLSDCTRIVWKAAGP